MADYLFSVRRDGNAQLDSYEGKDSHLVLERLRFPGVNR